jgi:hypothetical protein
MEFSYSGSRMPSEGSNSVPFANANDESPKDQLSFLLKHPMRFYPNDEKSSIYEWYVEAAIAGLNGIFPPLLENRCNSQSVPCEMANKYRLEEGVDTKDSESGSTSSSIKTSTHSQSILKETPVEYGDIAQSSSLASSSSSGLNNIPKSSETRKRPPKKIWVIGKDRDTADMGLTRRAIENLTGKNGSVTSAARLKKVVSNSADTHCPQTEEASTAQRMSSPDTNQNIKILSCISPSLFVVSPQKFSGQREANQSAIAEYCATHSPVVPHSLDTNRLYAVQTDSCWHRLILKEINGRRLGVSLDDTRFFSDLSCLYDISELELTREPFAYKCQLYLIAPIDATSEKSRWDHKAISFFKKLINEDGNLTLPSLTDSAWPPEAELQLAINVVDFMVGGNSVCNEMVKNGVAKWSH